MKQICCECGREMKRCECEEHIKRHVHKPRTANGTMDSKSTPHELYADNYDMERNG